MNLRKLNLGLVALLLGFGLVLTQSAFTPKTNTLVEWGIEYDLSGNIQNYVDLSGYSYQSDPNLPLTSGKYTCDVDEELYCTAFFEDIHTPSSSDPNPENGVVGKMRIAP